MQLNISEHFDDLDIQLWKEELLAANKNSSQDILNKYHLEGITYHSYAETKHEDIYLNTFPTKRILGRKIITGQPHTEQVDVGMEYIFSESPLATSKEQKLVQIITESKMKNFGDEVLLDVFSLLQEFDFSFEDLCNYLDKKCDEKNTHLLISSLDLHHAGANMCTELAHVLYLGFKLAEFSVNKKCKIGFMLPTDSLYFAQIAKLRAFRYMYETVLEKESIAKDNFYLLSTQSLREMTLYDPWMNMLRSTSSTAAAFIGGADIIIPKSFDVLNQIYAGTASTSLGLRQSRNVFHVLSQESYLSEVNDSSRGSKVIEDLTRQLIEKSFAKLKEMRTQKSFRFLYEKIAEDVQQTHQERVDEILVSKKIICGVNSFAKADERLAKFFQSQKIAAVEGTLFPFRRNTAALEELRLKFEEQTKKKKPKMIILYFGTLKKLSARIDFSKNYFEVLGIEVDIQEARDFINIDKDNYQGVVYVSLDEDYDALFEMQDISNGLFLFIAGKKYQKQGVVNIYKHQNIYAVLSRLLEQSESL